MDFSKLSMTPPHLQEAMTLMQSGDLKAATIAIQNNLSGIASASDTANNIMVDLPMPQDGLAPMGKLIDVNKLQGFTDTMKHFKLDLPTVMNMSAGVNTHSEQPIPDNAQFLKGTLKSSQGSHDYRLYIPSSYAQAVEKGLRLPLIVMLHGCTQSPEDFAAGTRMNELAEQHRCLIVYPSQPASANQNRCWNWFNPTDQQQGQGEPAWLAALTQSITKDYAVDSSRVYIAGLSAGAAMAVIMAEAYPQLYAAVGVHSGLAYRSATDLPSALMAMRQGGAAAMNRAGNSKFVPMIVFHGDQDHTVSIRNGNQIVEQAKQRLQAQKNDLNTQQHQRCSEQNCRSTQLEICDERGVSQLEYWKIHGAGHSWAGGSSAGSHTDPKGPDASKEMLRFFLNH
ncbi:PHB depolymerase family esterase [Psychrobacter sp. CAL346-MNA-CIBAN-0220]|uniref:extracellular catalytic domain type 1 short-chain-length polyhydroxyalkanoate depolymerase n=1 Tax=Psychrobacter sp. CAL346-MNA-CIBAN-0220 TaxID=3140457 RepID=UPI00332C178A